MFCGIPVLFCDNPPACNTPECRHGNNAGMCGHFGPYWLQNISVNGSFD
jgi:hypothetical protein